MSLVKEPAEVSWEESLSFVGIKDLLHCLGLRPLPRLHTTVFYPLVMSLHLLYLNLILRLSS